MPPPPPPPPRFLGRQVEGGGDLPGGVRGDPLLTAGYTGAGATDTGALQRFSLWSSPQHGCPAHGDNARTPPPRVGATQFGGCGEDEQEDEHLTKIDPQHGTHSPHAEPSSLTAASETGAMALLLCAHLFPYNFRSGAQSGRFAGTVTW